jgi:hypothetical protein
MHVGHRAVTFDRDARRVSSARSEAFAWAIILSIVAITALAGSLLHP